MADSKISQLPSLIQTEGNDIVPLVDKSGSTFTNKKQTIDQFFGRVPSNTTIAATLTVIGNTSLNRLSANNSSANVMTVGKSIITGNGVIIQTKFTPGSSSIDDIQYEQGKISYDANYLYIKVANNVIKRVALSSF